MCLRTKQTVTQSVKPAVPAFRHIHTNLHARTHTRTHNPQGKASL